MCKTHPESMHTGSAQVSREGLGSWPLGEGFCPEGGRGDSGVQRKRAAGKAHSQTPVPIAQRSSVR